MGFCCSKPRADAGDSVADPTTGVVLQPIAQDDLLPSSSPLDIQGPSSGRRRPRNVAPDVQLNIPIKVPKWRAGREWTLSELEKERTEFFETRVSGRAEIWTTLKAVIELVGGKQLDTAQGIVDAAGITVPTGHLHKGVYDEVGNLYLLPRHVVSNPENLVSEPTAIGPTSSTLIASSTGNAGDADSSLSMDNEDGESDALPLTKSIVVKARLSDRGGADVNVHLRQEVPVRVLIRRVQEEAGIATSGKMKIVYLGKVLSEQQSLQAQGWQEGHVVNALVFS